MPNTVRLGSLDALIGVTFGENDFAVVSATQVSGSITNTVASPDEVLTYQGLTGSIGSAFIALPTVFYRVTNVDDTDDTLTIDAYVGRAMVGAMDFTVAGFSAMGIALAAMPLDALVSQSGNLPGLDGSLFELGLGAAGATGASIAFESDNAYSFIPGATVRYATSAHPVLLGNGGGAQMLIALSGNDTITAGAGKTVIDGGAGADTLIGGSGTDTIQAGSGYTVMVGGTGADTFVFAPGDTGGLTAATADVIQNFNAARGDLIDLSAFDPQLLANGVSHLDFIGTVAFDHHAGELRYDVTATGFTLSGDLTGAGTADFMIVMTKVSSLSVNDFVL